MDRSHPIDDLASLRRPNLRNGAAAVAAAPPATLIRTAPDEAACICTTLALLNAESAATREAALEVESLQAELRILHEELAATRRQLAQERAQRQFLAAVHPTLTRATSCIQQTCRDLLRLLAPQFADWCVVDWLQSDGERWRVVRHHDQRHAGLEHWLERACGSHDPLWKATHVGRSGIARLYPEVTAHYFAPAAKLEELQRLEQLGLRSVILAPLLTPDGCLGVITLVAGEERPPFDERGLAFAEEAAGLIALSLAAFAGTECSLLKNPGRCRCGDYGETPQERRNSQH